MRHLFPVFALVILLTLGGRMAMADTTVSKAQALQAIDTFQKDPSSKDGFEAGEIIMAFAQKSPLVHISLSLKVVPWCKDKSASDADTRGILLTAYVAGNVEDQLKSGHATDDVYSGWEQVLNTYAQLLRINSAAKISEVDELKNKDADGSLRDYAAEVAAQK